jgi:hypothetical protein
MSEKYVLVPNLSSKKPSKKLAADYGNELRPW